MRNISEPLTRGRPAKAKPLADATTYLSNANANANAPPPPFSQAKPR